MVDSQTQINNYDAAITGEQPEFMIQRIYCKDLSLETPHSPSIFRQEGQPQTGVDLRVQSTYLEDNIYEVGLTVTVTAKVEEKVAFLVEVQQAGIFTIKGFIDEELKQMLGSYCPNILFPYAREVVSELVTRSGFPPLYLMPVNFDALYQQERAREGKA